MKLELINAKWCVNGKTFAHLTANEILILDQFFLNYQNERNR